MTTSRAGTASHSGAAPPRLSYLVFRLERRIRAHLDEALARHGVTTTEYMALSELRLREGPSSAQLARIAFVSAQAMNLVIRDLERRGLVRRHPDPRGGRILRVALTRAGLTTLRRCDRALDDIEQVMLVTLDEQERKSLASQLAECARALHPDRDPESAWPAATHPAPPPRPAP